MKEQSLWLSSTGKKEHLQNRILLRQVKRLHGGECDPRHRSPYHPRRLNDPPFHIYRPSPSRCFSLSYRLLRSVHVSRKWAPPDLPTSCIIPTSPRGQ